MKINSEKIQINRNQNNLLRRWATATIGQVCLEIIGGGTPSRERPEYFGGNIIWLTPTEIPKEKITVISDSKEKITKQGFDKSSAKIVPEGAVMLTSRATIGAVAIAGRKVTTNQGFASLVCSPVIYNLYVAYWLWANKELLEQHAKGTTFKEISKGTLRELSVPLPPLKEQKRIVAKLEELFTKFDAGIETLKKTQLLLKQYRQSVLKYAFEGKLTQEWRKKQKRLFESNELLDTIKEKQIFKNIELKFVADNSIPPQWISINLGYVSKLITKGESPKWQGFNYVEDGITFIRSENVLNGILNISNAVKIPTEFHNKLKRSQLKPLDVLVNLVGASIGRCSIVPKTINNANINQAVGLVRVNDTLNPQYLMHLILSPSIQAKIQQSKVETARPNISLIDLNELVIPIPSIQEQQIIVDIVETKIALVDHNTKVIDKCLFLGRKLRQAILRDAFEGKLVPAGSK